MRKKTCTFDIISKTIGKIMFQNPCLISSTTKTQKKKAMADGPGPHINQNVLPKMSTILLVSVLHPDVFWYRLNGMGTQKNALKNFLVTLFPYIFNIKTK